MKNLINRQMKIKKTRVWILVLKKIYFQIIIVWNINVLKRKIKWNQKSINKRRQKSLN